jgi:hypothetical protein
MKSFQQIALLLVATLACVSGFAPVSTPRQSAMALSMSKSSPEPQFNINVDKKTAAVAAFATAMAPFAAHAENTVVDESTIIGYGAGLVACVVSLAVGFSIGYGTLSKL